MVHWDRKKYRRLLFLQISVLLLIGGGIAIALREDSGGRGAQPSFTIEKRLALPLKEISGATMRLGKKGMELIVVGDRKAELDVFSLDGERREQRSFKSLLTNQFSLCRTEDFEECQKLIKKMTSNWEALTIDGRGRIFLLQEHTQSVVVLNRDMNRVERVLHFNFADTFPKLIARGSKKFSKNALGEGLLLLKNGHILVAKEQYPMALVEFGRRGDKARGLSAATLLGPEESFQDPAGDELQVDLEPLAYWILSGHSKCDISDLDHDAAGQLLVLSQACRQIGLIKQLVPGREAVVAEYLNLPHEILHPEALTRVGDRWMIGSDVASKRDYNFYILHKISPL